MELKVNGKSVTVSVEIQNVLDLLKQFELDHTFVIIELNEQIIHKDEYDKKEINNGDHVEIVHFVGGG